MYLIVGLNNPGGQYEGTRHNLGADFVDAMLAKLEGRGLQTGIFSRADDYGYNRVKFGENEIIFILPNTFMNNSGEPVARAKAYYKVPPENIIVACDDVNLDVGATRVRFGGSDGGHNGLKSIISKIGDQFWRVRIGVGENDIPLEDYVLQKPTQGQRQDIDRIIDEQAENMLELISKNSLENKTNKIN